MSGKVRPAADISNVLIGGPTAWDARLALLMATETARISSSSSE